MKLRPVLTRTLDDDYEREQLVPIWSKNDNRKKVLEPSNDQTEDLVDKLPASADLKLKCAALEAIIDDMIEDKVDEAIDNAAAPDSAEIEEEIEPVIEAAETLHLIPRFPRERLRAMIAAHLRVRDPLVALADKAAHFCAGVMTEVNEDALTAGEVNSDGSRTPGEIHEDTDGGVDSNDLVTIADPISDEVVEMEPGSDSKDAVTSDPVLPEPAAKAMRYLASSAINHRKASAIVSHRITGKILGEMLYELRYRLPAKTKQKYRLDY